MPAVTVLNGAPLRRIEVDKGKVRMDRWPYTIPAVRDMVEQGLEPSPGLIALLARLHDEGSQAIVATHSPLIAATPGAELIELGEWGMRRAPFEKLELVRSWRDFLDRPERYVKYLVQ